MRGLEEHDEVALVPGTVHPDAVGLPLSPMARLKRATAACHRRIETRMGVTERFGKLDRYLAHLEALAAFHRVAEDAWGPALNAALTDFPARCKTRLLEDDVRVLGGRIPDGAPAPRQLDGPSAVGGFYVLEGASLGGKVLLEQVRRKLGLEPGGGASYLASYGDALSQMWQGFGEQVNTLLDDEASVVRATDAACATFAALEDWLCGEAGR